MIDDSIKSRRHDLDWLRVLAFALLVYFHAAIPFIPGGIPLIGNDEESTVLRVFVVFLHQFRLALLFFVAGIGVRFAINRRTARAFAGERSRRLLLPLVFGILVLVPPMVYLEKVHIGEFAGSFASFYPKFFTQGVFPRGNLSWHHFWFLAYLFVYCVVGYPVISALGRLKGRRAITSATRWMTSGAGLYLPVGVFSLIEIALRASYPGFPSFVDDWANVLLWYAIFLMGFTFASSESLLVRAEALRRWSLVIAVTMASVLFVFFWSLDGGLSIPDPNEGTGLRYVVFSVVRACNIWCWIMASVGFASKYLNRPSAALKYLNQSVYPLFCLHLPFIVFYSFYIVELNTSIAEKYLVITTGTIASCFICYELVRRFVPRMGILIGIKQSRA